jgi:enamine deaminase RidA (YjgF/YER057c/UK114 family)
MTIERHGTTRRYSDAVAFGNTVHLVEVALSLDADITTQTQEVLASVEQTLLRAGSDKSRLLQVTIYLADIADIDAMNAIWDDWVPEGCAPARACVEARLANPGYRIEVVVVAARSAQPA